MREIPVVLAFVIFEELASECRCGAQFENHLAKSSSRSFSFPDQLTVVSLMDDLFTFYDNIDLI